MTFHAAIFDMDGLLLDTERLCMTVFQRTCTAFSIPFSDDVYTRIIGCNAASVERILRKHYGNSMDYPTFRAQWMRDYKAITEHQAIPVKEGVMALLTWLQQRQIPLAVATSTEKALAEKKLALAGLKHHFTVIVGGDDVSNGKPAPDIYRLAAQRLAIAPQYCLAFEDSNNGVKAAVTANMQTFQVIDLVAPTDDIRALGHTITTSTTEVLALLQAELEK